MLLDTLRAMDIRAYIKYLNGELPPEEIEKLWEGWVERPEEYYKFKRLLRLRVLASGGCHIIRK